MDHDKSLEVQKLIEKLISPWSLWEENEDYYLNTLAPDLVRNHKQGMDDERKTLEDLHQLLDPNEWLNLPSMIRKTYLEIKDRNHQKLIKEEKKRLEILREQENTRIVREKQRVLLSELRMKFKEDFPAVDSFYKNDCFDLITVEDFNKEKSSFVIKWVQSSFHVTGGEKNPFPDDEQALAICALDQNVLVAARAGSGKTSTLVYRALFLMNHCNVRAEEILILAFNKDAAEEVLSRLKKNLGSNSPLPFVMTFHAFSYSIVHPEESLLYDSSETDSHVELSRLVQGIIDDFRKEIDFEGEVRSIMIAHFREDWARVIKRFIYGDQAELLKYWRSFPLESMRGESVKSWGEKAIADFLFEHDIPYLYEKTFQWGDGSIYRPDFTIKDSIVIEYFGLLGDPDYDAGSRAKRDFWKKNKKYKFLEFFPSDFAQGDEYVKNILKSVLRENGIICEHLSEDEIWHRIQDRKPIDRFTKNIASFISKCRKRFLTPAMLSNEIKGYESKNSIEEKFLNIASRVYREYLERLLVMEKEDFDGLVQRAKNSVSQGRTTFKGKKYGEGNIVDIRHIMIDEYQDFSDLFYCLINSIRRLNPQIKIFCVGDDWQAINAFAGSDIKYFSQFEKFFGGYTKLNISTNYRSASSIVQVGNCLMSAHGEPSKTKEESVREVFLCNIDCFNSTEIEEKKYKGREVIPILLRVLSKFFSIGLAVVLISRTNYLNVGNGRVEIKKFLENIREQLPSIPKGKVSISTVHNYKGRENSAVILLDVHDRSYPLIHPDWIFSNFFGNSIKTIIEEERRLFYVALTRAREKLVILTNNKRESPFIDEIRQLWDFQVINWDNYPPSVGGSQMLKVSVRNREGRGAAPTFKIKEFLREEGYQYHNNSGVYWSKIYHKNTFKIDQLKKELWAEKADGINVQVSDEQGKTINHYSVDHGKWSDDQA